MLKANASRVHGKSSGAGPFELTGPFSGSIVSSLVPALRAHVQQSGGKPEDYLFRRLPLICVPAIQMKPGTKGCTHDLTDARLTPRQGQAAFTHSEGQRGSNFGRRVDWKWQPFNLATSV